MKIIILIFLIATILFPANLTDEKKNDDKAITLYLDSDYKSLKLNKATHELIEVLLQVCRLIEKANESDDPFQSYKLKKNEMVRLLKRGSEITQNLQFRNYLISLSECIVNEDYTKCFSDWLNVKDRTIDLIIKPSEKQKKIIFYLLKFDPSRLKKFEKYLALIDKMMTNSTMKNTSSSLRISLDNPFLFYTVLRSSEMNRFIFIHPDPVKNEKNKGGFKLIFCNNIIELYFKKIFKPISELILADHLVNHVKFNAYLSNLVMHRISHTLGPFNVASKSEELITPQEKLTDLFYCIEEIKAETVSFCNTDVLLKEKLISEKDEICIYILFILNLLEQIRNNPLDEENRPFLIILNFAFKDEGIIFDINHQKIFIDIPKLKKSVNSLMVEVIQTLRDGNYNRAKKLIDNYSSVTNVINKILQNIETVSKKVKIAVK